MCIYIAILLENIASINDLGIKCDFGHIYPQTLQDMLL
jgi:hypothetical protein